jgi:hypothetical protein
MHHRAGDDDCHRDNPSHLNQVFLNQFSLRPYLLKIPLTPCLNRRPFATYSIFR